MPVNNMYTQNQVEEIVRYVAEQVFSADLENSTCVSMPKEERDTEMGRQRVHVILPDGTPAWISGSNFSELITNALKKFGSGPVSQDDETFKEYTDKIFDIFLRPRWKPSTAETNRFLLDKHLRPYFDDMKLSQIDTATIQQFFQTKQHLSKSYTKQMLIMLHEIFQNAVEDGKVKGDPTMSKRITLPQRATKRKALEVEDFNDITAHIDDLCEEDALLMALLCYTGMRRGEILGLTWDNVLEDRILVRKEVTFKGNEPVVQDYVKSKSGIRDIPIPKELKPYLLNRKEGYVVSGELPMTQSRFARTWERIGKTIDLHNASPHIFRHTYLTLLAASDVDPKTIQSIAGHADFSFTFNKYIDQNRQNIQAASTKLSDTLEKLTKKLTSSQTPEPLTDKG
jgi:integrase